MNDIWPRIVYWADASAALNLKCLFPTIITDLQLLDAKLRRLHDGHPNPRTALVKLYSTPSFRSKTILLQALVRRYPDTIHSLETVISLVSPESEDEFTGFSLQTELQSIKIMILNLRLCCERYGLYLTYNGHYRMLVDAFLPDEVNLTSEEFELQIQGLNVRGIRFAGIGEIDLDSPDGIYTATVEIETNRGIITAVAWVEHNGLYPHSYRVEWAGFIDENEI